MKKNKTKKISGMTIVEMMVAIAIFLIGMTGFTFLFLRVWKTNSYVIETGQSSLAASQGLNKIEDYIRRARQGDNGAYPVESASDNDLVFFCDYDKDDIAERLHFYKSGENILLGITNPTETLPREYPSGDEETIVIVSNLVNEAGTPIFYYFNQDYPVDTVNNPLSVPVTPIDVSLIKIYLEISINPGESSGSTNLQSFVNLRNLN